MTDTVDLYVVGVEGDIPRAEMSDKLVKAFKQEAFTFEALLDGAYGESSPYAAQTGVEQALAEGGKAQLEKLGLICTVLPTGETPSRVAPAPAAQISGQSKSPASGTTDNSQQIEADEAALASFKADDADDVIETEEVSSTEEVAFDLDSDLNTEDSALASFKKDEQKENKTADEPVDFSGDLKAVGAGAAAAVGLAGAKKAKNNIDDVDDVLNQDFSDHIEDVGADQMARGLNEGKGSKPDFSAEVEEVDFSDDVESIGTDEKDSSASDISESKLEEEAAERDLASFPKEDTDEESLDFSDELDLLASDAPLAAATDGAKNKADVPEALAGGVSASAGDELEADLIDPAPIKKQDKAPVEIDDGGLSLSADDEAPLTAAKEKSNAEAPDDGGLSLSVDDSAPLTAPKKKADPDAVDDGGLNLSTHDDVGQVQISAGNSDAANDAAKDVAKDAAKDTTIDSAIPPLDVSEVDSVSSEPSATVAQDSTASETKEPAAVADPAPEVQKAALSEPAPEVAPAADVEPVAEAKPAAVVQQPVPEVKPAAEAKSSNIEENSGAIAGGLVLPGQLGKSMVPNVLSEDDLDNGGVSTTASLHQSTSAQALKNTDLDDDPLDPFEVVDDAIDKARKGSSEKKSKKKLVAAVAGVAVLAGAGSFAFMNAGSIAPLTANLRTSDADIPAMKDSTGVVEKMRVDVSQLQPGSDLENLSTGDLLVNLSNNQSNGIVNLEPYFLESGDQVSKGPRLGAAIPAESEWMIRNRQSHPADAYFDNWSSRDADLFLFTALLDNLIESGDLEVAQQLSDRAKDKLFSVMSTQRLARAYSDVGDQDKVTRFMKLSTRNTYAIEAPEERVLALSDHAFTEQAIGRNESATDTFLKTSILARSLVKPERRTVGLSSAANYFHRSGRTDQAQELLAQALQASNDIPKNTAARDLAIRYIAISEGRMGLFNQALEHTKLIVDPIATVSAYHGIALAIESTGDDTNARKVLNMAYRAGSQIEDPDERKNLLSKVVLASEKE